MYNGFAIVIKMKDYLIGSFGISSSILLAFWSLRDLNATRRKGILIINVSLMILETITQSIQQILSIMTIFFIVICHMADDVMVICFVVQQSKMQCTYLVLNLFYFVFILHHAANIGISPQTAKGLRRKSGYFTSSAALRASSNLAFMVGFL